MSADEVGRYINQIALSGTADFVQQLQHAPAETAIGHFGVGFYSAFMLASTVELQTRRASGEPPVAWRCTADMAWDMGAGTRPEAGTSVILHLAEDSPYLSDPSSVERAVGKYFAFPRVPIRVRTAGSNPVVVGDPDPVWRRTDAGEAEIRSFYREHFGESDDPIDWVRVASQEIGLRGMVFFRNTRGGAEAIDGRAEIYSRGVFVDTDVAGLIPKFVSLQHSIIECDELPLVVSRGQVRQSSGPGDVVGLVGECLSQEMAIALHEQFANRRDRYSEQWPELAPFVKYGVLTDRIFASVMTRRVLFDTIDGTRCTLGEYLERQAPAHAGRVFYASDPVGQAAYIDAFRHAGIPVVVLDHVIDQPLLHRLEAVTKDVAFVRLDADVAAVLAEPIEPADEALAARVVDGFRTFSAERLPGGDVRATRLRTTELPVALSSDEALRRMSELAQVSGLAAGRMAEQLTTVPRVLFLNLNSPVIRALDGLPAAQAALVTAQLVDLALLGQDELTPEQVLGFVARSQQILSGYLAASNVMRNP
jgi:molecular chaperone HtpG